MAIPADAGATIISIHALRGEGDQHRLHPTGQPCLFLSTPSVGRATQLGTGWLTEQVDDFYPRPPWGGRQQKCLKNSCTFVSNHTIDSLYTEKFCLNHKETGRMISVLPLRFGATLRDSLCELAVRTGSITTVKYHLAPMREKRPAVPPCFYTGFPAGKNAGCPVPDRSIRPAVL